MVVNASQTETVEIERRSFLHDHHDPSNAKLKALPLAR